MTSISVVIPAYNEASRIGRAIKSVLSQSRPVDEIIVVDDGSTDNTCEVAQSFGKLITCIRQENQGLAGARNTGIQNAKSEWIAFLDADDEWLPDHIETASMAIQRHPEIHWYCNAFERRAEDGSLLYLSQIDEKYIHSGIIENYFFVEAKITFTSSSSILVKKDVFNDVGLFNIDINHYGEDLDMWFRIALRYPMIGYSNTAGTIYYRRKGSITDVKEVNIPRFLRRIAISRSCANNMPEEVKKQSDLVVQKWVVLATKDAIRQSDRESLVEIKKIYFPLLPIQWQLASNIFQNRVAMRLVQFAIQARNQLRNRSSYSS